MGASASAVSCAPWRGLVGTLVRRSFFIAPNTSRALPRQSSKGNTRPTGDERDTVSNNEWHYSTGDDHQQGPVAATELNRLAAAGELRPDDLVWKEGMDEWVPASRVKGLDFKDTPAAPPKPKRGTGSPPPRPARTDGSSSAGRGRNVSMRMLVVGAVGLLLLVAVVAGVGTLFRPGGAGSTTAADYTSNEVREIVDLLRLDPACRDTRLGDVFQEDIISLELLDAVLGQPVSKAWNGRHHVWVYRTADGTATITPFRVHEDVGADGETVPFLDMQGTVQVVGLDSNKPVDRKALKNTIIRIKRRFDDRDGVEFEKELQVRLAEQRAAEEATLEAQSRELDATMEQRRIERETATAIARKADSDFHDHIRTHFRFGTPEREALSKQSEDWIARRVEALTKAWRADEDWRGIGLPDKDAVIAAIENGERVPVLPNEDRDVPEPAAGRAEAEPDSWLADGPPGIVRELRGHSGIVYGVDVSGDGTKVVSCGLHEEVILWSLKNGAEVRRFEGADGVVRAVGFQPGGDRIMAATARSRLYLWHERSGKVQHDLTSSHVATIFAALFTPNGRRVIVGDYIGAATVFETDTGEQLLRVKAHPSRESGAFESVRGLAITNDGRTLATASVDGTVRLWNVQDGAKVAEFGEHGGEVWSVAFSLDSRLVVSGSANSQAIVWDATTQRVVQRLEGLPGSVAAVAFLPNGKVLIGTVQAGEKAGGSRLVLWDAKTGRRVMQFDEQESGVWDIAVSPDGRFAVTAGADAIVRVFRLP